METAPSILPTYPNMRGIQVRSESMMPSKFTFIAPLVILAVSLVVINTAAGVNYAKTHVVKPVTPTQTTTTSAPTVSHQSGTATLQPANDNTALWTALISSLALNFFNLVSGMFNTWMQFKVKLATHDMQESLNENTSMTLQTKVAVKENLAKIEEGIADKSNHHK